MGMVPETVNGWFLVACDAQELVGPNDPSIKAYQESIYAFLKRAVEPLSRWRGLRGAHDGHHLGRESWSSWGKVVAAGDSAAVK